MPYIQKRKRKDFGEKKNSKKNGSWFGLNFVFIPILILFIIEQFYSKLRIKNMHVIPFLLKEIEQEAEVTHKFFKLITPENFQWKPHEKSRSVKDLTTHIAQLPIFIELIINNDELDLNGGKLVHQVADSPADLAPILDDTMKKATTALLSVKDEDILLKTWTMKFGDKIIGAMTKYEAIRKMTINHTIHHRSQLGVYLRLLNIPIPGTYGPSADEQFF